MLRRLSTMSTFLCIFPCLSPAGCCSIANLLYPCLSRTSRRSSPVHSRAAACFHCNDLCAGTLVSSLTTCPNNTWRFLLIMSVMFGRPVVSAMSTFFTWSCYLIPSIWCWHPIWKDCGLSLQVLSANRVHVSALYNRIIIELLWLIELCSALAKL